jgi:hypothetical protein
MVVFMIMDQAPVKDAQLIHSVQQDQLGLQHALQIDQFLLNFQHLSLHVSIQQLETHLQTQHAMLVFIMMHQIPAKVAQRTHIVGLETNGQHHVQLLDLKLQNGRRAKQLVSQINQLALLADT